MSGAEEKTVTTIRSDPSLKQWKFRLVVSSILLFLSLVGVVVSCLNRYSSFSCWYWTGPVIIFWLYRRKKA